MAKKRTTMAKKPTSQKATRARGAITLTAAQQRKAQKCLDRSGKVVIGFKQVSVQHLPKKISGLHVRLD